MRCAVRPRRVRRYDCFRTWQALAVGSVPLVVEDPVFDQRLVAVPGVRALPRPEALTPAALAAVLASLGEEAPEGTEALGQTWAERWRAHL